MAKTAQPNAKTALCIGINDYPGTNSDLDGCVNDANDWAKELTARGYTVKKLLNKKATGAAIRRAIKTLVQNAVDGDTVLVTFSGHGSFVPDLDGDEPDGTDECLCPYDVRKGEITDDELYTLFQSAKRGVKVVMIADSCHSGTVARYRRSSARSARVARKVRFLPPEEFLSKRRRALLGSRRAARAASPPGRHASLSMTGCQDVEKSYDAEFGPNRRPNGAFSYFALQELKKLSKSATYQQWYTRVRKNLPTQEYPQTPNLVGSRTMKRWKVFS